MSHPGVGPYLISADWNYKAKLKSLKIIQGLRVFLIRRHNRAGVVRCQIWPDGLTPAEKAKHASRLGSQRLGQYPLSVSTRFMTESQLISPPPQAGGRQGISPPQTV
jgi:hypothetical protein